MEARYANGRAAVTTPARCLLEDQAIVFETSEGSHSWRFAELRRADDGNGRVILKRTPDTGERLYLAMEAAPALRRAAPALFEPAAQGAESGRLIGALAAAAFSLAGLFLIGVPMASEPLARIMPMHYRTQIGQIAWGQIEAFGSRCEDSAEAERVLSDLTYRFLDGAHEDDEALRRTLTLHVIDAAIPNAFALPDNSIVVTDDLLHAARHPDEVAGVIAHELAHLSRHHVMANVIRNIGAGVFFDIVFGGAGLGQAAAVASVNLAALSYSREHEQEADAVGLDYLDAAAIDPAALARFFERIQEAHGGGGELPAFLSSHPATPERIAAARARAQPARAPSMSATDWRVVQAACGQAPAAVGAPMQGKRPPPHPAGKNETF